MDIVSKRIKSSIEYILIFVISFIGIRKGGYYKEDSLIGIYIIFLISIIYFLINNKIKYNKTIGRLIIFFSFAYALPIVFLNTATVSGAINFAIRIYSIFLVYIIVTNSENKEKYKKALLAFTIICGIFALDELSYRIFNTPLKALGGGYVEENNGRVASIFQYSNLLGIMCLISILCLLDLLFKIKNKKCVLIYFAISFLTIVMFLTQSKMVVVLYLAMTTIFCTFSKKQWYIIYCLFNFIYCLLASSLIQEYSVYIILPSLGIVALYGYMTYMANSKNKKAKNIIDISLLVLTIIVGIFNYNHILNSGIVTSINEYIDNFNSTKLRFTYYIDALKIICKTPLNFLIGSGGNAFRTLYETVQTTEYISLEVHSLFIQVFLESGVVGLVTLLAILIYTLRKSSSLLHKVILISIIVFSTFDVFLTYTFMLYIFVCVIGITKFEQKEIGKKEIILNIIVFAIFFMITTTQIIALFTMPVELDNLNNSLEKQESIIKRCEIALKLDSYDLEYMRDYNLACGTYLEILDIKKELYNTDDTQKRAELILKIYNNTKNEIKYERKNKYAIEDNIYYTYNYLDELVNINYEGKEAEGYEYYLDEILSKASKLKEEHSKNGYAMEVYNTCINKVYTKFSYVNDIINSDKIDNKLNMLKENEDISL